MKFWHDKLLQFQDHHGLKWSEILFHRTIQNLTKPPSPDCSMSLFGFQNNDHFQIFLNPVESTAMKIIFRNQGFEQGHAIYVIEVKSNMQNNKFWFGVVNELNVRIAVVPKEAISIFVTFSETSQSNMDFIMIWNMCRFISFIQG